jgi:hypothetical protein
MKITVSDLKQDRQWRSALGVSEAQFRALLPRFTEAYFAQYKSALSDRKVDTKIDYCINNEEELLLFALFSLKAGLTYDVLGIVCGMSASNAQRNQAIGIEVLGRTLTGLGHMPKRKLLTVKDLEALFQGEEGLIIDATEQHIQRPGDKQEQKDFYSGKKKLHTLKAMAITTKTKAIKYLSAVYVGTSHDFSILKTGFPPIKGWFKEFNLKVDLGYLGIAKEYECKSLSIPHTRTKNKPLTEQQKSENKQMAAERICVENSFAGLIPARGTRAVQGAFRQASLAWLCFI